MTTMRDDAADALTELRDALAAVTPSATFAASVRTRVAAEREAHRSWLIAWLVPVGVAAAVIVAVVMRREAPPAPSTNRSVVQTTQQAAAPPQSFGGVVPGSKGPAVPTARVRTTVSEVAAEPTPEVITNQGDLLRSIWAKVRGAATEVSDGAADSAASAAAQEIAVDAIQVQPIVVGSIDQQGSGGGSGPVIRRVAADATGSER
jgi:hypothetical protein